MPRRVLKEYRDLYEEEADEIEPSITKAIGLSSRHKAAAARIVDKTHAGFPHRPYDGDTDLYTAAIATVEGCAVLTTASQSKVYDGMGCDVIDLESWLEGLDPLQKKTG